MMRWGRLWDVLVPGTYSLRPFSDELKTVFMGVDVLSMEQQNVLTQDGINASISGMVRMHVRDVVDATFAVRHVREAVLMTSQATIKSVAGRYAHHQLLASRASVAEESTELITDAVKDWGVVIDGIDITDILIPEKIIEALSAGAEARGRAEARLLLARADQDAAVFSAEAARILSESKGAMALRALEGLEKMSRNGGTSTFFVPSDLTALIGNALEMKK